MKPAPQFLVILRLLVAVPGLMAAVTWAQQPSSGLVDVTPGPMAVPGTTRSPGLVDAARGPMPVLETTRPPLLGNAVNDDARRPRNFDAQPPTIPHRVDGYQIDRNFNKCLDCHARDKTADSQAVPVSRTHYLDRSGKVLPQISTRRYFCQQCHVAQDPVLPLVGNDFENVNQLTKKAAAAPPAGRK